MNENRHQSKFTLLPTARLDGEAWIQCHLRLTFRFQANHGISLHLCDPARRCLRIGLGEILDHRSGRAIYEAIANAEIDKEFQDAYIEYFVDLDHLDPEAAARLAFNLAMDDRWDQIERSALAYCDGEAAMKDPPDA